MVVLAEKEVAHLIHSTPKTNKTFSGVRYEDAVAPPRDSYKGRKNRQGEVKPLETVVLYTDLLFQLPPTLTIIATVCLPAFLCVVLDMRYVAMRRKTTLI